MNNINDICKKDAQWFGYALSLCKCEDKAKDLVQDMYINLMDINKPLKDWYVIATIRNLYFNERKSFKNVNTVYLETQTNKENYTSSRPDTPEDVLIKKQDAYSIHKIISELPDKKKNCIEMYYFKDYTYKDISEEINEKVNNVCKIMHDARKQLKTK